MSKRKGPRRGSLRFWPRKRAKRAYARVRSWVKGNDARLLGFAGYKVGMTHIMITDNKKTSKTKGQDIRVPVTVIECPPIKVASVRFYKKTPYGLSLSAEKFAQKLDKELSRKIVISKKQKEFKQPENFDSIRLNVYTQPKLTTIGKKKPELFEIAIGGNKEDQLKYAEEVLGKEVKIEDVFTAGQQLDIKAITKGKGFQGTTKRYGTSILARKSEKTKRGKANLGPWVPKKVSFKVPQPGRMGFHQRTELNKYLFKISNKVEEINPKGGFINYGNVKSSYIVLKGSIIGSKKRLILFAAARRPRKVPKDVAVITYTSLQSKQGN